MIPAEPLVVIQGVTGLSCIQWGVRKEPLYPSDQLEPPTPRNPSGPQRIQFVRIWDPLETERPSASGPPGGKTYVRVLE